MSSELDRKFLRYMNAGQKQGMFAIGLGFILITIAGVVLALLADNVLDATGLILSAVGVFVIVAPIYGFGIYRYASSTQQAALITADEMEKPRQLLDILKTKGHADIETLTRELNSNPDEIRDMIDDLTNLALFSGIINWEDGAIAIVDSSVLGLIEACKNCQNPITVKTHGVTICAQCRTEYHQI